NESGLVLVAVTHKRVVGVGEPMVKTDVGIVARRALDGNSQKVEAVGGGVGRRIECSQPRRQWINGRIASKDVYLTCRAHNRHATEAARIQARCLRQPGIEKLSHESWVAVAVERHISSRISVGIR